MRKLLKFVFCFFLLYASAQEPEKLNASEIFREIKQLNFLGAVLYIGAHPDDENTSLISYFSNYKNARTAYLSLTRGDGGQNLIGPELREQLGIIRTQELLAARAIDKGQQFFTRANDFGYSKTPEETLEIWDKEKVLSDVVWVIRQFKPDVIINRFDHRTPGSTHGHHTSSALLSLEAFEAAADKDRFVKQLTYTQPHKTSRLYFNTSAWFYDDQKAFEETAKSKFLSFDTGVFYPLIGLSNPEISSLSRSQHQSQGFGSTGTRGSQLEYLEPIAGDTLGNQHVFEGIDTSWNKLKGGAAIGQILDQVEKNYNFKDPAASLPALLEAYKLIAELPDKHWRDIKTKAIKRIIYSSAGLFLEAVANQPSATPQDSLRIHLEAINRSDLPMELNQISLRPDKTEIQPEIHLKNNEDWQEEVAIKLPEQTPYSTPYWLKQSFDQGMYSVEDQQLIGLPETPQLTKAVFSLKLNGIPISFEKPIVYKYNHAVFGETYQPFEIIPEVSLAFEDDVMVFEHKETKQLALQVTAGKEHVQGEVRLSAGEKWKITPEIHKFKLQQKGSTTTLYFDVTPPKEQDETFITPTATSNTKHFSEKLITIDYNHIPRQNLVVPSKLKAVRLEIKKKGERIGYIEGAGDVVPESLQQIGYRVDKLQASLLSPSSLGKYDAVVLGIRAFNTVKDLSYKKQALFKYVKNGGTLIIQYNTNRGMALENIAPYSLNLSRDRVTDESAEVRFLAENHPLLNSPNQITKHDFENWVQERGLYFPDTWGEEFTPILSMNDKNEPPKDAALLVAKYGEGYVMYTGLSFFRQFPAGVPGAYRLFANMISIGK